MAMSHSGPSNQMDVTKTTQTDNRSCGFLGRHSFSSSTSSSGASMTAAPAKGKQGSLRSQSMALPHTITERHGGLELWVKAPVLSGEMDKQGFRWRKKWKRRFVELNGRALTYFPVASSKGDHQTTTHMKPRLKVQLTADGFVEDMDERTFAVTPCVGEKPWVLRTPDERSKRRWCKALMDEIDILKWLQHYSMGRVLGVGGNGVVQELVDKRSGNKFACKMIDVSKFKNREAVVAEVEIMRDITNNIKHPNLVTIYKVYEEQEKIFMTMDLCSGGELYDSIVQRGSFSEGDAAHITRQLLSALQALHDHNILHLDIKPENILLSSKDADAKIMLTDFGLARMINGRKNPLFEGKSMAGTVGYIAPEVITAHSYTTAADVFSAGVILYILLVGYPPFFGDSEIEILLKIARGDFQFKDEHWGHISTSAKELVARMLAVRVQDRITIDEIMNHPWIRSNDDHRELPKTMARLKSFNFDRKSENMGSLMANMLRDDNEQDFLTLMDEKTIDMMIRQVLPEGHGRIVADKIYILSRGLCLSPYVDEKAFTQFLDRDQDGYIDAQDFCESVKAIRANHESFVRIVFNALLKIDGSSSSSRVLTKANFQDAFEKLECPMPLRDVFFKYWHAQAEEAVAAGHEKRVWCMDESHFVAAYDHFSFVGFLLMRSAKDRMVTLAKNGSVDDLPRISEDSWGLSEDSPGGSLS